MICPCSPAGYIPAGVRARAAHHAPRPRDAADAAGGVRVRPAGGVGRRRRLRGQAPLHRARRARSARHDGGARAGAGASLH